MDSMTVSREVDESDMREYLRPIELPDSYENDQLLSRQFAGLINLQAEDIFDALISVEFLFYKTISANRQKVVGTLLIVSSSRRRSSEYLPRNYCLLLSIG